MDKVWLVLLVIAALLPLAYAWRRSMARADNIRKLDQGAANRLDDAAVRAQIYRNQRGDGFGTF